MYWYNTCYLNLIYTAQVNNFFVDFDLLSFDLITQVLPKRNNVAWSDSNVFWSASIYMLWR